MKRNILVYFKNIEDDRPKWTVVGDRPESNIIKSEFDELKFKSKTIKTTVVVPAEGFSCYEIDVKTNSRKKALQAARFLLEDKLLTQAEDLFFAYDRKTNSRSRVWVCSKELIASWLKHLARLELAADRLIPETIFLEPETADYALWLAKNRTLLHDGLNFVTLNKKNIAKVLDSLHVDSEKAELPVTCKVHNLNGNPSLQLTSNSNIEYSVKDYPDSHDFIKILADRFSNINNFNLLQGEFVKQSRFSEKLKPWRLVASLILTLGLLHLFSLGYQTSKLKEQRDFLQEQINKIYLNTFPKESVPSEPYKAMQARLNDLEPFGANAKGYIATMLSDMRGLVGTALRVENISFSGEKARVTLKSEKISELESAVNKINKTKYIAKIVSVAEKSSGSEGILEIKRQ